MLVIKDKFECQCNQCKGACTYNPGWFLPGEAEKVAEYLSVSLQDFFNDHIGVNWWESDEPIFVLAPALVGEETGAEYPGDPRGQCVFYKDELCIIHPVKPHECAALVCDDPDMNKRHREVAGAWKNHQDQIANLLGHEPESEEYYGDGPLGSLLGW